MRTKVVEHPSNSIISAGPGIEIGKRGVIKSLYERAKNNCSNRENFNNEKAQKILVKKTPLLHTFHTHKNYLKK